MRAFSWGKYCSSGVVMRPQPTNQIGVWDSPAKFAFLFCRSLNMDFENQDKEKDNSSTAGSFNGNSTNNSKGQLYSLSFFHHFSVLCRLLFHPAMCGSSCFAALPDVMELFCGSTCHQLSLCPRKLNLSHQCRVSITHRNFMLCNLSGPAGYGNCFYFYIWNRVMEGSVINFSLVFITVTRHVGLPADN